MNPVAGILMFACFVLGNAMLHRGHLLTRGQFAKVRLNQDQLPRDWTMEGRDR
jgi:hypothetical protein